MTGLQPHSTYSVRVRAKNLAGESDWSDSINIVTAVDLMNIPRPQSLIFEKSTNIAHVEAPTTDLLLVAELEVQVAGGMWRKYGDHAMAHRSYGQMTLVLSPELGYSQQLPVTGQVSSAGSESSDTETETGLRVRLCLEDNMSACGPYLEARVVEQLDLGQSWLVALIVIVTLLGLVAMLVAIKCVCQSHRRNSAKSGTVLNPRHAPNIDSYKTQMFSIAADNQHGSHATAGLGLEQGSASNSHTDSANSQEPLWAYQKSPSDYYPAAALEGYDNGMGAYPYIDETPTEPDRNYFAGHVQHHDGRLSRPVSGQCKLQL